MTKELTQGLTPKQNKFMDAWLNVDSKTFGNAYQSGIAVDYSDNYSRQLTARGNKWMTEYVRRTDLTPEHINQALTSN